MNFYRQLPHATIVRTPGADVMRKGEKGEEVGSSGRVEPSELAMDLLDVNIPQPF